MCLRGKPGWGDNMAFLTAMVNTYGGQWFDMKWKPQFEQPVDDAMTTYVDLMKDDGPPGASANGFNENLALFNDGKCGMWIDATIAASFVTDPKQSKVADKVGFALAPNNGLAKSANWLWAWNLAIPAGSKKVEAAAEVHRLGDIARNTSSSSRQGRLGAGADRARATRPMQNAEYQKAAQFAKPR